MARESVQGAIQAVSEIGGETPALVKDTVIGFVEGTGQVVTVTTPVVREVVVGAVRGSSRISDEVGDAGREAVEGAIVGAAAIGLDTTEAASAAVEGAVEGVMAVGGDLRDVAEATIGGVVSGVAATGGDVAAATRGAAYALISHEAVAGQGLDTVTEAAEITIDTVLKEAGTARVEAAEVITATATGVVEAAYHLSQEHGDSVRRAVVRRFRERRLTASPELDGGFSAVAERLATELPRGRAAWRGVSMIEAARLLIRAGGIDLAASLAYFTILSLLPLAALVMMTATVFIDPETVRDQFTATLIYYFPSSQELIYEAVDNLLGGSLFIGVVALIGIAVGANGLFMAANRAVNRLFGAEGKKIVQMTLAEVSIAALVMVLFVLSLGVTAFLHVVVSFGEGIVQSTGSVSVAAALVLGAVSTVLPIILTMLILAFVYRRLPNVHVEWRDATFGAMIAVVVFEMAKHMFFWFTSLTTHRHAVYGPIASVVVLMMWGYIASLIFLYGAALAKCAGDRRPTVSGEDDG